MSVAERIKMKLNKQKHNEEHTIEIDVQTDNDKMLNLAEFLLEMCFSICFMFESCFIKFAVFLSLLFR